jgi:pyruvate/2-oxoacid:ferredoxin oxidoreductase beta subunit
MTLQLFLGGFSRSDSSLVPTNPIHIYCPCIHILFRTIKISPVKMKQWIEFRYCSQIRTLKSQYTDKSLVKYSTIFSISTIVYKEFSLLSQFLHANVRVTKLSHHQFLLNHFKFVIH